MENFYKNIEFVDISYVERIQLEEITKIDLLNRQIVIQLCF